MTQYPIKKWKVLRTLATLLFSLTKGEGTENFMLHIKKPLKQKKEGEESHELCFMKV